MKLRRLMKEFETETGRAQGRAMRWSQSSASWRPASFSTHQAQRACTFVVGAKNAFSGRANAEVDSAAPRWGHHLQATPAARP